MGKGAGGLDITKYGRLTGVLYTRSSDSGSSVGSALATGLPVERVVVHDDRDGHLHYTHDIHLPHNRHRSQKVEVKRDFRVFGEDKATHTMVVMIAATHEAEQETDHNQGERGGQNPDFHC